MKRAILGLLIVVVLAGGFLSYRWLRPKQLLFDVQADFNAGIVGAVSLSMDGHDLGQYAAAPIRLQVPGLPQRRYSARMVPRLTARALFPCGWTDVAISMNKVGDADIAKAAANKSSPLLRFSIDLPSDMTHPVAILWVDNFGHAPAKLAVGQDERTVTAGAKEKMRFIVDECEGGRRVTLDGEPIGELPNDIKPVSAGSVALSISGGSDDVLPGDDFLLDTSGKHCYRMGEQYYGRGGFSGFGYAPPYSTVLKPAFFHRLPPMEVHFFLQELPERIETQVFPGPAGMLETRNYIRRVDCRDLG